MLNSVKSDVVKKANMLKAVHWKWLETSKRLMNLHFKKPAGGNISAYFESLLLLNWVFTAHDVSSFLSGWNTNIASPRKEMSGKGIVFLNQSSSRKFVSFINNRTQLLTLGKHFLYSGMVLIEFSFTPHSTAETGKITGSILQFWKMRGWRS